MKETKSNSAFRFTTIQIAIIALSSVLAITLLVVFGLCLLVMTMKDKEGGSGELSLRQRLSDWTRRLTRKQPSAKTLATEKSDNTTPFQAETSQTASVNANQKGAGKRQKGQTPMGEKRKTPEKTSDSVSETTTDDEKKTVDQPKPVQQFQAPKLRIKKGSDGSDSKKDEKPSGVGGTMSAFL